MSTKFYPPITAILPVDALPNELGFIKTGLTNILSHIYFRDLQFSNNDRGDSGFYSLQIVSLKRLDIEIPGTGIYLILNPSHDPVTPDISEFPVSVSYTWPILGYLRDFNLETFSFQPGDIFDLALRVLGVTEREVVERALSLFVVSASPIDTFVDDVNALFGSSIPHPAPGSPDPLGDVLDAIDSAASINGAGAAVFALYLLDALSDTTTRDRIKTFFADFFDGESIEDYLKTLITPKVDATLDVGIAIEFPRNVLEPLNAVGGEPLAEPARTWLTFNAGSLYFSTDRGIGFDELLVATLNHPSRIAGTSLGISLNKAKLDISRTTNIPEADADGRPADFVGVYIDDATISFPAFWNHDAVGSTGIIRGRDLLIGTGGFSGTLSLEAVTAGDPSPVVKVKFGDNFSISLDTFSLTLKQNAITASNVEGTLRIPGFKDANDNPADIRIKVAIRDDGDFDVTAHEDDGFKEIKFGDVFKINLKSVYFGKKGNDFYLGVSGGITFTHPLLANIFKDEIEVEKLLIWSDGRFEIEGGTIPLPQNFRFPIGPVEISISALHFGSHQQQGPGGMRNYRYFGFDGGVDINPGGVDVRGKGIKFYYTVDDGPGKPTDRYLEIKSIAIDLVIPGNASKESATLLVSGFLNINGTSADPEYEGGVSFSLPKVKIAGGAAMKYRPKAPAFIVDAFVELANPIPLGGTGLGIYGFRGLFGHRYVATKHAAGLTESDTWFQYYKAPPSEGVVVSKFETPDQTKNYDNPFSIGAGISLATAADSGKTFSTKLFLLLSLPGLIYLEGKANVLGERVGLTGDDPPFFAYLAISPQSVETGFGADYDLPKSSGAILDVYAEIQAAFFFQNSSAWYVNFGREDKRITARVLSLFNATAYVMLSAAGIAAGAGVSFGFDKSYAGGMVRASVGVYIEVGGRISFERPQIGGFAMLGGHVDAYLLFIGFHIGIDTSLLVEVPKPFIIQGKVHLCVGVTIGFWKFKKRIEKCFDVEFKWEKNPNADTTPVVPFDVAALGSRPPLVGMNMLSGESFNVKYVGTSLPSAGSPLFDQAVVPLDSWVDLEFLKGMLPQSGVDARVGRLSGQAPANYIDLVPPAEVPRKVKHEYSIKAMEIKAWNGSAWVDYRPYQAMSVPAALAALSANPSLYKDGFWQNSGTGFNKMRLLAETSLSYMQQGEPGWYVPEQFGITSATLFCSTKLKTKRCVRWSDYEPGKVYPDGVWQQDNTVLYRVTGGNGVVFGSTNPFGFSRSLRFENDDVVQIVLNKPCAEVSLKLTTLAQGAVVRFYKRETVGFAFQYTLVETRTLSRAQLDTPVVYSNGAVPIAKVEIDPMNSDPAAIYALQVQIDDLYRQLYERNLSGQELQFLLGRIREAENSLARLLGMQCGIAYEEYDQLIAQRDSLMAQVRQCDTQLEQLIAQQNEACQGKSYYDGQFAACYWYYPVLGVFSYWIYLYWYQGGYGYRFHIHDDERNLIILSGVENHPTVEVADSEMYVMLDRLLSGELSLIPTWGANGFSFHVGFSEAHVIAFCPHYFAEAHLRDQFMHEVWEQLKGLSEGGAFTLTRRWELQLVNYWIYEYWFEEIFGYRYNIYDVDRNLVILSSAETYPEMERANVEMRFMLERLMAGEFRVWRTEGEQGFSFTIGYSPDHVAAFCPHYFGGWFERESFLAQVWEKLMTIWVDSRITIIRRWEVVILSYWIYDYWYDGTLGYRFHIYDDALNLIMLSGVEAYSEMEAADAGMYSMLERLMAGELVMWPTEGEQGFSFTIGYGPDHVVAFCPRYFNEPHLRDWFMERVWQRLMAVYIGGRFVLIRRWGYAVVCPVPLYNIGCWREMGGYAVRWGYNFFPLIDHIEAIRYGRCYDIRWAYRDLYFSNWSLTSYLNTRCTELTQQASAKTAECRMLSEQLAEVEALIAAYVPPLPQSPCITLLHEVCFLSLEDHQFNITVPGQAAVESDYQNAVAAIQKMLTPIWRPDTKYAVRLQVTDKVNDSTSTDFDFYFGFRTAGPLGYFHTDPSAGYVDAANGKTPDQYMLTGLKGYIDYQRSYPNADGELIRAKPLFYEDARILLFYTKRYVYHFFGNWPAYNGLPAITGSEMQIVIKDPSEDISMLNPPPPLVTNTQIPQAIVAWPSDSDPRIPEDIRTLMNLRNPELLNPDYVGGDCWASGGEMIKPASVYTQVTPQYLKPLKLYTAVVNNLYKGNIREVHRYVFQTSRYADFGTQVNSYQLSDGKGNQRDAIFQLAMPLAPADITLMYDIVAGTMSAANAALAANWADPFDRLVEGAMKLTPLDAAISTEFNIVRNQNTNAVVAVWIRNPEPFNDPKLPDDVLARSLRVMNGLAPDLNYKVMFSKDRSQAFVMHPSSVIPVTQMKFRFAYIEWDGSTYVDRTVITTGFIDMNY